MSGFQVGAIKSGLEMSTKSWNQSITKVKGDLRDIKQSVKDNAQAWSDFGKKTALVGLAIGGALGLMAKKASDYEETTAKFGTVYSAVFGAAETATDELTSSYGLSSLAAKTMMGNTGDLLTGLGTTSKVALDLSLKTQKLAVDLASFTNIEGGAERASNALTKAMLGERESLKTLGVVIREEMITERLREAGLDKLTGTALLAAKAELTLTMVAEQSKNAQGDYARTSTSTANVLRELKARTDDLVVELGSKLTPMLAKGALFVTKIATAFADWAKENPILSGTFLKIAGTLAVVLTVGGSLLYLIPKIVTGIEAIRIKMMTLGPMSIALLAIGAAMAVVTAATNAWGEASDAAIAKMAANAQQEKKSYDVLRAYRKVASDEEKQQITDRIRMFQQTGFTFAEASAKIISILENNSAGFQAWGKEVAEKNLNVDGSVKVMSSSVISAVKSMTSRIQELTMGEFAYKKAQVQADYENTIKMLKEEGAAKEYYNKAAVQLSLELSAIKNEQLEKSVADQQEAYEKLTELERKEVEDKKKAEDEKLKITQGRLTSLYEFKMAMREESLALQTQDKEKELEEENIWFERQVTNLTQMGLTVQQREEALTELVRVHKEKRAAIDADYLEKSKKKWHWNVQAIVGIMSQGISIVESLFKASYNKRSQELDAWYQKEKKAIDTSTMNEEEKAKAMEALDKEMDAKKLAMQQKNAKREKAIAIAGAIMNTAQSITSALTMKPWTPANFILAGIAGAMGLAQVAVIASQPLPMAEGGMVKEEGTALLHKNEVVMPYNKVEQMMGSTDGENVGVRNYYIYFPTIDPKGAQEYAREVLFPLISGATKDEDLLIHESAVRAF